MDDELIKILTTPSIIITLDNSSERIATQIEQILTHTRKQKDYLVDFYRLFINNDSQIVISIENTISNREREFNNEYPPSYVYRTFVKQKDIINNELKNIFTKILDTNRLINAGYSFENIIPTNIYILADCKNKYSAACVIPMIALLNDLANHNTAVKLHIMLNISHFLKECSNNKDEYFVYVTLNELVELFKDSSNLHTKIFSDLLLKDQDFSKSILYLFHHQKESPGLISNNELMETLIGNALFTLLQDKIANKISENICPIMQLKNDILINSIGALAVIYDPESLQKELALKNSIKAIEYYVLSEGKEGAAAIEASIAKNEIGSHNNIVNELLQIYPDSISQVIHNPETDYYEVYFKDLNLEKINFLGLAEYNWKNETQILESKINNILQTDYKIVLQTSIDVEFNRIAKNIENFAYRLPQKVEFFPGGLDTCIKCLDILKKELISGIENLKQLNGRLINLKEKELIEVKKTSNKISRIVSRAPRLPKLISKLPQKYQELIASVYYHLIFFIPLIKLKNNLNVFYEFIRKLGGLEVQILANDMAISLINSLCDINGPIELWKNKFIGLGLNFKNINNNIISELNSNSEKNTLGLTENFRISAIKESISKEIYNLYPFSESIEITDLIINEKLFESLEISEIELKEKILNYYLNKFSYVWELDLEEIHRMYVNLSKNESPLNNYCLSEYLAISRPPLSPRYNGEDSLIERYYLMGNIKWSDFDIQHGNFVDEEWETIGIDNPYALIFTQTWKNVPFSSINYLFSETQRSYSKLTKREKANFDIFGLNSFVITLADTNEIIEREYQWQFTPKGSTNEYTFRIRLKIDRKRYDEYRSKPRTIPLEQWNFYAEEDVPEINNLVLEFQKIFLEHGWSTYNKAYCVLNFVQNAIKYEYDKDSKGHSEWPRYPIETLTEEVGDCEDVAILCASVLARLGFDVVLIEYLDHMAFGVAGNPRMKGDYIFDESTGKKYYYGEATNNGWSLGEIPNNMINIKPIKLIKVELTIND